MYCENCGNQMSDNAKFCSKCGAKTSDSTYESVNEPFKSQTQKKHKNLILPIIIITSVLILSVALLILFNSSNHNSSYITNDNRYNYTTVPQITEFETQSITDNNISNSEIYYNSTTNSKLSAKPGTAMVLINGVEYIVEDNKMDLNYAECVNGVFLYDIDDKSITVDLLGVHQKMCTGFKTDEFESYTTYITLKNFYDSTETDSYGSPNYGANNLISYSSYDKSFFKTTDMVVEQFDTSGLTAIYFHILTEGLTTGKKYDIEILSVSDYSNVEPAQAPDVCTICGGIGSCFNCSGTGKISYYNAVTKSMSSKNCTVCGGTGKCSTCHGSGKP